MKTTAKSVEFEGNSVDEAIKTAMKTLGVSRETMRVKVLCEEQKGLFGMDSAKPAKIKVTIKQEKT
jgi:spoIIIJ-associated protein